MSKAHTAAKVVPAPQGTQDVKISLEALTRARQGVQDALAEMARTVRTLGVEGLSKMHDRELGSVLTEVARARDGGAIVIVALSMKGTENISLSEEEAKGILYASHSAKASDLLVEGKNTNLADLLIAAIKAIPGSESMSSAARVMLKAGVRTDKFVNAVLRSGMNLSEKMEAIALIEGSPEVYDDSLAALEKNVISRLDHDPEQAIASARKIGEFLSAHHKSGSRGQEMIQRMISHRECACAPAIAKLMPEWFDAARDAVLSSGSPEALATFWRTHSARCDKKVFHERLTEAVRPDPEALANAILDGKGAGRYPVMFHPMMGPMVMGPMAGSYGRRW